MLQIQVPATRRSGEHSNCAADSVTARCRAPKKIRRLSRRHRWSSRRCRTSRKLTRHRRRSSCRGDARQLVVPRQRLTSRRSRLGCSSAVQYENDVVCMPVVKSRRARFRHAEDIEAHTDTVHRQDRRCSREGETPPVRSTTDASDSDVLKEDLWSSHRSSTLKGSTANTSYSHSSGDSGGSSERQLDRVVDVAVLIQPTSSRSPSVKLGGAGTERFSRHHEAHDHGDG